MTFLARKNCKTNRTQTLREHSANTAAICGDSCARIGLPSLGNLMGLLHDLGKCTREFQQYLDKNDPAARGSVKHAAHGARFVIEELGGMQSAETLARDTSSGVMTSLLAAVAIYGHHIGSFDITSPDGRDILYERVFAPELYDLYHEAQTNFMIECNSQHEIEELFDQAVSEVEELTKKIDAACKKMEDPLGSRQYSERMRAFAFGMLARFLASALIDADRFDAYCWACETDPSSLEEHSPNWCACCDNISVYLKNLASNSSTSRTDINEARRSMSRLCSEFAISGLRPGVFRLTAATGSGKTLASLLMVVRYAARPDTHTSRIIYLAPYKNILTQNAEEWRTAIGGAVELLEHHGDAVELPADRELDGLITERWSSPFIVTTLVQFLYTLFSDRPARLRRFQALANAVIVIDEIQSVPARFTHMINAALNFLASACNCTVICMTATQPALDEANLPLMLTDRKSIVPPELGFAPCFDRVSLVYRKLKSMSALEDFVLERSEEEGSVLVIMNTKKAARTLWKAIQAKHANGEAPEAFLLTADLCGRHREDRLNEIKKRLIDERKGKGESIICVSTTLVEAGVDVSFPCGIRSLAGIDAALQAAGRVNRHGERAHANLYLVRCGEDLAGLPEVIQAQGCSAEVLNMIKPASEAYNDAEQRSLVDGYYRILLHQGEREHDHPLHERDLKKATTLFGLFSNNPSDNLRAASERTLLRQALGTAGRLTRPIDDETQTVLVPYREGAELIKAILKAPPRELPDLLRAAQPYTVNLRPRTIERLGKHVTYDKRTGIRYLAACCYTEEKGVDANADETAAKK